MLDRFARGLLIWIVLAVLAYSASPAFQQATVACPTCNGAGHAALPCLDCSGAGRVGCQGCTPVEPPDPGPTLEAMLQGLRAADHSSSPEAAAKRDELAAKLEDSAKRLNALRRINLALHAQRFAQSNCSPGNAPCPAGCTGGRVLGTMRECAYCKARGAIKCEQCDKPGSVCCRTCKGAGTLERGCGDCSGSGRIADPALRPVSAAAECPLCSGRFVFDCTACDEDGTRDVSCRDCHGDGERYCQVCAGSGSRPCGTCAGIGYERPSYDNGCDDCKKRGRTKCLECKQGKATCPACNGQRSYRQKCATCFGHRKRACPGCVDQGFHGWEVAGTALLRAGAHEPAKQYFTTALQRAERHHERRQEQLLESGKPARSPESEPKDKPGDKRDAAPKSKPPSKRTAAQELKAKQLRATRDADIERLKKRIAEASQAGGATPTGGG